MKFEQAHMVFQKSPAYQIFKLYYSLEMIEQSDAILFEVLFVKMGA